MANQGNSFRQKLAELAEQRSKKNEEAFRALEGLESHRFGIIRQELDTFVRVVYVIYQPISDREKIAKNFLENGRFEDLNGKRLTDRALVEFSQNLEGWTKSVYSFGCSCIHLSPIYFASDSEDISFLLGELSEEAKQHLATYHRFDPNNTLTIGELAPYMGQIFAKIHGNLQSYIELLLLDEEVGEDEYTWATAKKS